MSTLSVRLPESLHRALGDLAHEVEELQSLAAQIEDTAQ